MRHITYRIAALLFFVSATPSSTALAMPLPGDGSIGVNPAGPSYEVGGTEALDAEAAPGRIGSGAADSGAHLVDTRYADRCGVDSGPDSFGYYPCAGPSTADYSILCPDTQPVPPLWLRTRSSEHAAWTDWSLLADAHCSDQPTLTPELVLAEFRRLPLTPSPLTRQPARQQVLVNVDTIAYTTHDPQTLTTTILGTPVTIVATPTAYTWDFADGDPFTTTSSGHPYPDQDVAVAYTQPGDYTITLTTTWSATYTLGTDPTIHTVPGTATTTSTTDPFEAVEATAHLVRGTCIDYPHDPGC